jgi:PhzF family phenazine biosynthesis protein
MTLRITQVDAFTPTPFAGNPAAVCLLPKPRADAWMQAVAREINLAETAFLLRDGGRFGLRWFTPATEVDLCGHATLASAHVLWEEGQLARDTKAVFETRSGVLTAARHEGWITLDFPATPPAQCETPPELAAGVGAPLAQVARTRFDYLVEVDSEATLRRLQPDLGLLGRLPVRGIIVTAGAATPGFDFVSRFFAPAVGVPEDPVTGSAHCALGPYWAARLGRTELIAYQASPRGGTVRVRLAGDRVLLGGQAVTVLRADLVE